MKNRPATPPEAEERSSLATVARELARLERRLDELENEMKDAIAAVPEERRESARNLVHYVALRQHDLRDLQLDLAKLGLSSLGRSEGCVRGSLLQVAARTHEALALRGDPSGERELSRIERALESASTWEAAKHYLHHATRELLGPRPDDRHIYVMVTAPSADEADRAWMTRMLRAGMNVLRVNCAHEDAAAWTRMAAALDEARRETGKECRLLMDLAGPKIRTGAIAGARRVATWKPSRDEVGKVVAPARVVIRASDARAEELASATLIGEPREVAVIRRGDELWFRDARGKRRSVEVIDARGGALTAHGDRRAYVVDRARFELVRDGRVVAEIDLEVGASEGAAIDVRVGDELLLTARDVKGRPPKRDDDRLVKRGVIACTLPAALARLDVGHRVMLDDGKIEGVVVKAKKRRGDYVLRVARTQRPTVKLRAEKGINLPDTVTDIPALGEDDARALETVVKHADAVSLSFVRRPEDVRALHDALDRLGRPSTGVVLKIETRAGFENLPRLLLEGLKRPPLAVMIARGDLAVEAGFERLAELQEEILWLCEASHVPAIWATQVLDNLARTGVPSRAEVTDAAASVAAECVMLNKGPFVEDAVHVLADILRRMEKHHYKKRSLFRKLQVSTFGAR